MAAHDIKRQLKGLRVDPGRRKGRRDPFATGFEDDSDSDDKTKTTSATQRAPPVEKPLASAPKSASITAASPFAKLDAALKAEEEEDDALLSEPKSSNRIPSPAPPGTQPTRVSNAAAGRRGSLPGRAPRSAIALAAGDLAYLDESEDDEALAPPRRTDRRPSPAPRKSSDPSNPSQRSSTPRGSRDAPTEQSLTRLQPSRHTVASPFAGTKYLEDSESSDEEAVSSRQGSTDSAAGSSPPLADPDTLSPYESALSPKQAKHPEIKRVDKPKTQNGGGVSWRAFSASRTEQRTAELEAIQASLRQRGKSIAFGTHAITDDGKKVPIAKPTTEQIFTGNGGGRGRSRGREKSPPRRAADLQPTEDELGDGRSESNFGIYDPAEFKTNPFSGQPLRRRTISNPDPSKRPIDLPDIHINDVAHT